MTHDDKIDKFLSMMQAAIHSTIEEKTRMIQFAGETT